MHVKHCGFERREKLLLFEVIWNSGVCGAHTRREGSGEELKFWGSWRKQKSLSQKEKERIGNIRKYLSFMCETLVNQ